MKKAGFDAFTPEHWTYQHGDQWVTLNPDGPGSDGGAYDSNHPYFKNGWTWSSDPSTWRKPEEGLQDVSLEFYTSVLGIGSVIKSGVQALGSAVLKQTADEGAEIAAATTTAATTTADTAGTAASLTLDHYTDDATAALIESSQLGLPGRATYSTNAGNLSPLQAQIELALPTRNTATSIFAVDARVLDSVNLIRAGRVTGNVFNRGGGGTEFLFNQVVPRGAFRRIR